MLWFEEEAANIYFKSVFIPRNKIYMIDQE